MRKESAIIRKCSAQRTGEPFHYASIQHILSNVMNAGILRSGETKSEVFPELQIVSLEQFNRVAKTREQRSVNYAIKCGGTTETVQLEDGTEATVVRPPRAYPRKIVGKALLSGNVYCGHCGGRIFAATARKTHRPTESNERIAIYKCYNRSQHKGQCDGPSTYRAEKVDKVIEQLLRGIFERAKKVDEKTILKMLVDASAEQCQQELKAAKLEYTKTMKELSRWGDLMLDSLDGTCVFTPEQVKARLDAVQAKADEIAHQVQQLEEKSRQMKPAAADLLREHQQILTWAELFDSAAIEEKKVIASYLIKAVTLTRGYTATGRIDFAPTQLDRSVIVPDQMRKVLTAYKDSIYTDLFPDRDEIWEYIPKTLIFAKDDNHATEIVNVVKEVFADKFKNGVAPDKFVQKITYSAGDSNALIRDLRTDKEFRIAVTVTLVATGTDVKPLEVVLFMNDVKSDVLYTQMKGRGCRVINEDKLREITPNANTKECFYIVDAVGVTEHDKTIPKPKEPGGEQKPKVPTLERLLEYLSHGEVSDDNLALLRDYCASINMRYENNVLFGRHLNIFISDYGFAPKTLAYQINTALSQGTLPPFTSASNDNSARNSLISCLMLNLDARKKLLELHRGYYAIAPGEDEIIDKGFTKEAAKSFIDSFEKYLNDNADKIEALRIIYNSEDTVITYSMLSDLRDKLLSENRLFTPYNIWSNYKMLDMNGDVEDLDVKQNIKALTHLIQLVRYAYKKTDNLKSLLKGYSQRFTLYCGQAQRPLSPDQQEIMKAIADYIINEGSISVTELNSIDTDLWRKAVKSFGIPALTAEMIDLSKFILKAA